MRRFLPLRVGPASRWPKPKGALSFLSKAERLTVRRNKPWFGPIPSIGKAIVPVSWEGYAVTGALLVGIVLLPLVGDRQREIIAFTLLVAAYCAVVFLTWSNDPD